MSQDQVYQFLKKDKDRWYSAKQIAEKLKVNPNTVRTNCARLLKTRSIHSWTDWKSQYKTKKYKYKE